MPVQSLWSYGGNIVDPPGVDGTYSPLDEVRYLVQDTDTNVRLLADTEINYEIAQWLGTYSPSPTPETLAGEWQGGAYDHPLMAAHACALRIAAKFAGVVQISADGVNVAIGDLATRYTQLAAALADEYERISQTGGDVDITNLMWDQMLDPTIRPTTFGIGMNDNPLAGLQDYGGLQEWPGGGASYGYGEDVSVP